MPELFNHRAERAVLGGLMKAHDGELHGLTEEDFSNPKNKKIFSAISELVSSGTKVDMVTVLTKLGLENDDAESRENVQSAGGFTYVTDLPREIPIMSTLGQYVETLKDSSKKRAAYSVLKEAESELENNLSSANEAITRLEQKLFDITQGAEEKDLQPIEKDAFQAYLDFNAANDGIKTGFVDIDSLTAGFQRGNLIILGARPSMGKSALAVNMGVGAAKRGNSVAVFSLEMTQRELNIRVLCAESRIPIDRTKAKDIEPWERKRLLDALANIANKKIFIDETASQTVASIRGKLNRLRRKHGLDIVIIDYLQLMQTDKKTENRNLELSGITRSLKLMAKDLDVPVLALSQLNRDSDGRRPRLSDLRDSGAIEQDADVVMFLHREEEQMPKSADLIFAKHRNGALGTIELYWEKGICKFSDCETRYSEG